MRKFTKKAKLHGAALIKIIEHDAFTALNKGRHHYGHYIITYQNHSKLLHYRLLAKYRSGRSGSWRFAFRYEEIELIRHNCKLKEQAYLCLICGDVTICLLNENDFHKLLGLNSLKENGWIRVNYGRGSMWVDGSAGKIEHSIRHNAFPNAIFAAG